MMQYCGGKQRIAAQVADEVRARSSAFYAARPPETRRVYVEPFVGMGAVALKVWDTFNEVRLSDAHPAVVALWKHVTSEAPLDLPLISKDAWTDLKSSRSLSTHHHAIAGFGCAFGAQYFNGYYERLAKATHTKLGKMAAYVRMRRARAEVALCDFEELDEARTRDCVIYCDPPYARHNTHGNSDCFVPKAFDSDGFWAKVRRLSARNCVLVSETEAPPDFEAVWTRTIAGSMAHGCTGSGDGRSAHSARRTECLFVLRVASTETPM